MAGLRGATALLFYFENSSCNTQGLVIVCLYTTKPAMNIKQTKFKNFTFTNSSQFEDAELTPIVSSLGWLDCNLSAGDSPLEVEEILAEMRDWGVRLVDNKGKAMVRGD